MAPKLSVKDIRRRGYEWPRYALVEEYAVIEKGQVDLSTTIENLRSSRSFYRGQLNEAYTFKTSTGADYSDFTDRFDEYARMERELGQAIAYLEEIVEAHIPPFPQSAKDDASKDKDSNAIATRGRSLLLFFSLVFALSVPIWLLGALTGLQLLEGLPVSSLMAFTPLIAAWILTYKETKAEGAKELLHRAFDHRRIRAKSWYAPIVLLKPGLMVLSYGLMRWMRLPLPTPHIPVLAAGGMFLAFLIAALGEEVGWMGYAIEPMQDRWNALQASIFLGLVWAAWHVVPFVQAHRSPAWIAWQCLFLVASRVLTVWLYNNTGKSVFATALFHATGNVSWQLFPTHGSHYDPRITGLITTFVAATVTVVWGPRTLARFACDKVRERDRVSR